MQLPQQQLISNKVAYSLTALSTATIGVLCTAILCTCTQLGKNGCVLHKEMQQLLRGLLSTSCILFHYYVKTPYIFGSKIFSLAIGKLLFIYDSNFNKNNWFLLPVVVYILPICISQKDCCLIYYYVKTPYVFGVISQIILAMIAFL